MNLLNSIFKKIKRSAPPIPPFEDIVKMMYDKDLPTSKKYKIVKVIYNKQNTKRFILLEGERYYKYLYQELCLCNQNEWEYVYHHGVTCPAYWEPCSILSNSFFHSREQAMAELQQEPIYKRFFV